MRMGAGTSKMRNKVKMWQNFDIFFLIFFHSLLLLVRFMLSDINGLRALKLLVRLLPIIPSKMLLFTPNRCNFGKLLHFAFFKGWLSVSNHNGQDFIRLSLRVKVQQRPTLLEWRDLNGNLAAPIIFFGALTTFRSLENPLTFPLRLLPFYFLACIFHSIHLRF